MKRLLHSSLLTLSVAASAMFFAGCATGEHGEHSHGTTHAKAYPLKTCMVSGEAFSMGKPFSFVYQGQEILLCCKDCKADFDKEPAKYLSKLSGAK